MAFFQRPDAGDGGSKTWTSEAAPPAADRDAARRAFLRMVSHELRTPLNSIIGFADILHGQLYGPLGSPEYVEYAGIIRDSGARLLHLFNNVLELIRLEGGGGFSPAPEPVQPWLDEAVTRRRAAAEARGVGLRLRPSGEKLSAAFDPKGLLTCLDHLIGNAVDFTAAGDAVEISARRDGAYALISVYNRGPAPAPDDIERLMNPFEQGGDALSRSHEGAGLGWPIVRLTAQAMGGEFRVATREGEALKAVLRFPAA
jgi:signal transduction histidine kinase